jgi:formimidoylglutamate deiminase
MNRVTLPGLVNAHSHSFQRIFRGQTEGRSQPGGNFWTWRDAMYRAVNGLSPEDLYAVARMAFLEMALSGITTVGEFHYIHRDPDGNPYSDPNLISKLMVRAAREVGLRICLLRVAYARAGFDREPNPLQKRFIEPSADEFLSNVEALRSTLDGELAWVGVAPHSVRAVPLGYLGEVIAWAGNEQIPIHMHAAEQPIEISECQAESGTTPIALLDREGLLSDRFTAVHGIHVTRAEIDALALARSFVCACPTTERNLGDGIFPAADYLDAGVCIALGSDSQAQIDLLEDARELEHHLRLQKLQRGLLDAEDLFQSATKNGAACLAATQDAPSDLGDYFTVDLDDVSIAGSAREHLLSSVVFGMNRSAVRDVVVGGEVIVREGRHALQWEIVEEFLSVTRRHLG